MAAGSIRMTEVYNKVEQDKSARRKNVHRKIDGSLLYPEYAIRKTKFFRFKKNNRDIFVNNITHLKGLLQRCEKLFDNGVSELIIHGLGAAIYKAVSLALQLKEIHHGCLDLDIKTSTVILEDKLEALNDELNDEISKRRNSAIHIRVFRKIPLAVLRTAE